MPETITGQYRPTISSHEKLIIMSPQYWTDIVRRYLFDVWSILDADIEPISANIGPILRRLHIVSWNAPYTRSRKMRYEGGRDRKMRSLGHWFKKIGIEYERSILRAEFGVDPLSKPMGLSCIGACMIGTPFPNESFHPCRRQQGQAWWTCKLFHGMCPHQFKTCPVSAVSTSFAPNITVPP